MQETFVQACIKTATAIRCRNGLVAFIDESLLHQWLAGYYTSIGAQLCDQRIELISVKSWQGYYQELGGQSPDDAIALIVTGQYTNQIKTLSSGRQFAIDAR
jgi:hypothetical protein